MASQTFSPTVFNFNVSYGGLNDTRVLIYLNASRWQQILCLFFIGHWTSIIPTMSCFGWLAAKASSDSSEWVNELWMDLLILLCTWIRRMFMYTPLRILPPDPFCQGCFTFLSNGSFPLCPVVSLINYLHVHGLGAGPLFLSQDDTPLSRSWLSLFLQTTLQSTGVPWKFSGHSFKIGAATTAAGRGLPDHLIKTMGRCSGEDTCYMCVHHHLFSGRKTCLAGMVHIYLSFCYFGCLRI